VIGQAGGALPGSDLSRVQIVRSEGAQRRTLNVDVASTLRNGDVSNLPALRPGDTVTIPMGIGMAQYSGTGGGAGVIGEVGKPGLYPVGDGQDVWTLLAVAGGPTRQSKLSDIRVITREGGGATVVKLDLKEMLQRGSRQVYTVKDGDVIYVPQNSASKFISVFGGLSTLTSITLDVFQIMVLQEVLKNEQNNP
jgi:protein involved in polysaccharide export with SLBB domain